MSSFIETLSKSLFWDVDRETVVIAEAQQSRSLDPVTLSFAACLGNVKEESFRCFASTQSNLRPWNS